jgi:hypothetical protein
MSRVASPAMLERAGHRDSIDNHVGGKIKEATVWECQEAKIKCIQWQQLR